MLRAVLTRCRSLSMKSKARCSFRLQLPHVGVWVHLIERFQPWWCLASAPYRYGAPKCVSNSIFCTLLLLKVRMPHSLTQIKSLSSSLPSDMKCCLMWKYFAHLWRAAVNTANQSSCSCYPNAVSDLPALSYSFRSETSPCAFHSLQAEAAIRILRRQARSEDCAEVSDARIGVEVRQARSLSGLCCLSL